MAFEEFERSDLEPVVNELGLTWDAFMEKINLGRDSANEVHRYAADRKECGDQQPLSNSLADIAAMIRRKYSNNGSGPVLGCELSRWRCIVMDDVERFGL